MAPTLAMAVTGSHAAGLVGRAAPVAYALSAIGVAFVAYGFIRLASHFAHAGSVYAFTGLSLGPRAGFISGWALLGTYIVFPAVSILGIAVFSQAFLRHTGIADSPPWWPFALAGWAVIGLLATRNVRTTTRSLLAVELAAVVLILALVVVIFAKLATGDAPHGLGFSGDFVRLPDGVGLSTVVFAASVGFLSFAGFEAAGSFGEESKRPMHTIPRSMIGAIAFGGVFYVICMVAQTLGFGTDAAGVKQFSESAAPLGDLGQAYVGSGMARGDRPGRDRELDRRRPRLHARGRADDVRVRPRPSAASGALGRLDYDGRADDGARARAGPVAGRDRRASRSPGRSPSTRSSTSRRWGS